MQRWILVLTAGWAFCAPTALAADKPATLYDELYRPQFHFTPAKNWMNDPNGLVFYKGEYHLFFQHNPKGTKWGNMTWGHAVSSDMLHWTQLDHAIHPDALGTIFSGSAVVDWNNTAGFQNGDEKTLICLYTSGGDTSPGTKATQSLAYSNDRGRTWKKYEKNPVLPHMVGVNRDPKVFWHEPTKKWIMALYLDKNIFALFESPNLKEWTKLHEITIPNADECPDLFALPVDGDAKNPKWVFWAANNTYLLGNFDGKVFTQEAGPLRLHFGKNRYAAQTFSDIPAADGRKLQIAWMSGGGYPNMPFNQQLSIPVELTLKTFPEGVRLCASPVKEIESLRGKRHAWTDIALKPGENPLESVAGELFDIRLVVDPGKASELELKIRGLSLRYDVQENKLACLDRSANVEPAGGLVTLRILVDRSSVEVFAAEDRVHMAYCFLPAKKDKSLTLTAKNGEATIRSLEVWELKSTWPK